MSVGQMVFDEKTWSHWCGPYYEINTKVEWTTVFLQGTLTEEEGSVQLPS